MSFRLSRRSLDRLEGVHPRLIAVVREAILRTPVDFMVTEGLRTRERQAALVRAGAQSHHPVAAPDRTRRRCGGSGRWSDPVGLAAVPKDRRSLQGRGEPAGGGSGLGRGLADSSGWPAFRARSRPVPLSGWANLALLVGKVCLASANIAERRTSLTGTNAGKTTARALACLVRRWSRPCCERPEQNAPGSQNGVGHLERRTTCHGAEQR